MIALTLSTLFLNRLMEQIFTLYALNLFIVESVNCLGKKYVQGWKMYFRGFNGIFKKSIQNIPQNSLIFSIITSFVTLIDFLLGLIDQFTEGKRESCTFGPGNCYYLILFDILLFNILSWVLLLNDHLETRSPHIIAKLDCSSITLILFWKVFLIPLSWFFLYGIFVIRAYYMFLRYKPTFYRYGHRVRFFAATSRWSNFM